MKVALILLLIFNNISLNSWAGVCEDMIKTPNCIKCGDKLQGLNQKNFQELREKSLKSPTVKSFALEIKKRVEAFLEIQIKKNQISADCFDKSKNSEKSFAVCALIEKSTNENISANFKPMVQSLALARPVTSAMRLGYTEESKFNKSPKHSYAGFIDLPTLNNSDLTEVRKLYKSKLTEEVKKLQKSDLESPNIVAEKILDNKPVKLTPGEKNELGRKMREFRSEQEKKYYKYITENPILGFVTSDKPDANQIKNGYLSIEKQLKDYKKSILSTSDETTDWTQVFVFNHIVEDFLKEHPDYCSVSFKAQKELQSLKNQELANDISLGIAAGAVCLASSVACIVAGTGVGLHGVYAANHAVENVYASHIASSKLAEYESIPEKERELWLQKVLLPAAFLGAGKAGASALKTVEIATVKTTAKETKTVLKAGEYVDVNKALFEAGEFVTNGIKPGSVSERLGITSVGKNYIRMPKALKLNEIFNLNSKDMKFVAGADSTFATEPYHRALARGEIVIVENDPHDVMDHAAGFYYLSKSIEWGTAKKILTDTFKIKDSNSYTQNFKDAAMSIKASLTNEIENITGGISRADRMGNYDEATKLLHDLEAEIRSAAEKLNTLKSSLPSAP